MSAVLPETRRAFANKSNRLTDCRVILAKNFFQELEIGAGDESRTRDLQLGKLSLYRLSYTRTAEDDNIVPGVI